MRSSNKSRSRNKGGHNRRGGNFGNIVNRVFESSGPEGRVRGTPQQIIEKFTSLAHDAQLAGDRIASENFAQHAEHYSRLLGDAQRQIAEKREAMEAQRKEQEQQQPRPKKKPNGPDSGVVEVAGSDVFPQGDGGDNLVETPENSAPKQAKPKPAPRKRKQPKAAQDSDAQEAPQEPIAT